MTNIELIHIGEDYATISFVNDEGVTEEIEVAHWAAEVFIEMGQTAKIPSFMRAKKDRKTGRWYLPYQD
jgi:hypothetical protein